MGRLQHAQARNETIHTAWGPLKFNEEGIAHMHDEEGHAALASTHGFLDPDAPPPPAVTDNDGNLSTTLTHHDLVRLETALQEAHRDIASLKGNNNAYTAEVAKAHMEKRALEEEIARLRVVEAGIAQGSPQPATQAQLDKLERLEHENQGFRNEIKALKQQLHEKKTGADSEDMEDSRAQSPAIQPGKLEGTPVETDQDPAAPAAAVGDHQRNVGKKADKAVEKPNVPGTANPDIPGKK